MQAPVVPSETAGDLDVRLSTTSRQTIQQSLPDQASAQVEPRKFSSTQVNLPPAIADAIVAKANAIPDEDLAPNGRAGATPDTAPHVTVKYGLHTADAEEVRALLADEPPITVTLGKTSFFPNSESDNGDVLKVDVDSPDLRRLNKKIADALEVTDTHPGYTPHVSIAYLKPGLGKQYAGDESLQGQTVTLDSVRFSSKDGQQVDIPLTGQARIDTNAPSVQTVRNAPESGEGPGVGPEGRSPLDRVTASVPTRRESPVQQQARRTSHYRDVFRRVLADAKALDPLVTPRQLRKEFDSRITFLEELDDAYAESGQTPRDLLEAIAAGGGISMEAEKLGGLTGELRWVRESDATGPYGNFGGVPNVFRKRQAAGVVGRTRTGLSLDEMATNLSRNDPRFAHITGPDELLAALEDVARMGDVGVRGATYLGTRELATRAGMKPGEAWWRASWDESQQGTEPEPLTAESYQRAFGGTPEQADAVIEVYRAMGISLDKLKVAKGGPTGELTQPAQFGTPAFRAWFGDSKVVDADGQPLRVYHGTQRLDRFGPTIKKARATSGPMPFFTADREVAVKYATGKADTSLANEDQNYETWFRLKVGRGRPINLDRAWWHLTSDQRVTIAALAPRVTTDPEGSGEIRLGPVDHKTATGGYDQHIKEARGNHFKALIEEWLSSGNLFNDERSFETVLRLAGAPVNDIEYHDPNRDAGGVAPVYLSIQRPLDTEQITDADVAALESVAKLSRSKANPYGADPWDKSSRDLREWVAQLKDDRAKGVNSFVWSSIPDAITKTLAARGYDGIMDTGGKMGGVEHVVWIPFEPTQVKSAIGNRGTFDPNSPNILYQGPRGSVSFTEDSTAIIRALENPNVSTGLHEAAHVARRFLFDRSLPMELREGVTDDDILTAEQWAGATDGEWSKAAEEKFARGFERYLYDGEAPSSSLRSLFEKLLNWLAKVYRHLSGSPIDLEISPPMREVFDRLITRSERLQEAEATGDASFDVAALESEMETLYQDDAPRSYKPGNPFADKAIHARTLADRLNAPTAHERGMAQSFPLGAGFGRPGGAKRIDASVNRAGRAVEAEKRARYLEAQAAAFDAGTIDAQGRRRSPASDARSDKAAAYRDKRQTRIEAAKTDRGDKPKWEVPGSIWADSTGNLGGGARQLILGEHREAVEKALVDGLFVPDEVLAEYPDLARAVLPTGETQPRLPGAESVREQ